MNNGRTVQVILLLFIIVALGPMSTGGLISIQEYQAPDDTKTTHALADAQTANSYVQRFEEGWPPAGWSEVAYQGYTDWVRSSSVPYEGSYSARIYGISSRSSSGILQSQTYDSTGSCSISIRGYFRDVGIDNGDVLLYLKDNSGTWNPFCDLDIIAGSPDSNSWRLYEISTTDYKYKHAGFSIRYYAKSISRGEIVGIDYQAVTTTIKYWGGSVAANQQWFGAYGVKTTITTPSGPPDSCVPGPTVFVGISVFDSTYSYDQLGFGADFGNVWRTGGSYTTHDANWNLIYHGISGPILSTNTEYTFSIGVAYGYVSFVVWQGATQIWSEYVQNGAVYLRIEPITMLGSTPVVGFTDYEEVTYYFADDIYYPQYDFWFENTMVDGNYFDNWNKLEPGPPYSVYTLLFPPIHTVYVDNPVSG